jgi:hypothetical protein
VVCATAPEPNARTPASTAILVHDPFAFDIAVPFFGFRCGLILGLDHREATGACKSEFGKKYRRRRLLFSRPVVKQIIRT